MLCSLLCEQWGLKNKDKDTFLRGSFQWAIQTANTEPTRKGMACGINGTHSGKQGRVVGEDPLPR